jgi:hypothetical protein
LRSVILDALTSTTEPVRTANQRLSPIATGCASPDILNPWYWTSIGLLYMDFVLKNAPRLAFHFPKTLIAALLRCSGVAHSGGRLLALVILDSSLRYCSERPSCFMRSSIAYA